MYSIERIYSRVKKKTTLNILFVDTIQTHLVVALDSIDEGLISNDLGFSIEECLESLFDCLQMLLTDLKER